MKRHATLLAAACLILAALGLVIVGEPGFERQWTRLGGEEQARLDRREVQIDPAELLGLIHDDYARLLMLDLRDEADYNLFHLKDARRVGMADLGAFAPLDLPPDQIIVLMSNDELRATEAWQRLRLRHVPNVYILAGGLNAWLDCFGHPGHDSCPAAAMGAAGGLRHRFPAALGDRVPAARPAATAASGREFTAKVQILQVARKGGGCG